jgi:ATP-dependent helicase HrpA
VALELRDFSGEAELENERGLIRMLMLQLPQQVKALRKSLLQGNQINLQLAGISQRREDWVEDLLVAVFRRVFIVDQPVPRDAKAFEQLLQQGKERLVEEAQAGAELLKQIAQAQTAVRQGIKGANQLAMAMAVGDIQQQLARLFAPHYIADTPWQYLQSYPRYLQAVARRLEKLRGNLPRDRQLTVVLEQLEQLLVKHWQSYRQAEQLSPLLVEYRWLLEEFRVSLFAQQLGTLQPVSEKRLKAMLADVKKSLITNKA